MANFDTSEKNSRDSYEDLKYNTCSVRHAAYSFDEKEYESLIEKTDSDGEKLIFGTDEFGKSILDYITKFESLSGIRYLILLS